jgi:glycosyltransferase involved in cell wall biosynthesis
MAKSAGSVAAGDPLRVLMLIKGLGPGGAEHLLLAVARHSNPLQHQFTVGYVLVWKDALVAPLTEAGANTTCLGVADAKDPRWIGRLWNLMRNERYDVVHVHSPVLASVVRLISRAIPGRPPVVTTDHNSWASHGRLTRLANRLTFSMNDAHIAVSRQVVASMPKRCQAKCEVIVQGVDLASIEAIRKGRECIRAELGIAPDEVAICTVANLRWQKGYPDLLAAARSVVDSYPKAVFLAVGQGPLEADLKARHEELGLGDRFRFLGYRSDAVRIVAASDVFALASLHEGYPIAIMEALACGLPVVATDAGGVPDAIRNGVEGFVVPSQQPQRLAESLLKVIRNAELRTAMGAAALQRAQMFSLDEALRRTEEIYDLVITSRGRRRA